MDRVRADDRQGNGRGCAMKRTFDRTNGVTRFRTVEDFDLLTRVRFLERLANIAGAVIGMLTGAAIAGAVVWLIRS